MSASQPDARGNDAGSLVLCLSTQPVGESIKAGSKPAEEERVPQDKRQFHTTKSAAISHLAMRKWKWIMKYLK